MRKKVLILSAIFLLLIVGVVVWRAQKERTKEAKLEAQILKELSAEDIKLMLESEAQGNPQQLVAFKENPEARNQLLKQLRTFLALAAQARRDGLTDDPNVINQIELSKKKILAQMYAVMKKGDQPESSPSNVTAEEIKAFMSKPENEEQFKKDLEAQKALTNPSGQLKDERLEKARNSWARAIVISQRAEADADFMQKREVQLVTRLQEAKYLATIFVQKRLTKQIEPTKEEMSAYLAAHPEYDLKKKHEKAEAILQRAKGGEDFTKLVKDFSEDQVTKDEGGLYDNSIMALLPEVEEIAIKLEKGQVADKLIETTYGYHIVKLEDKKIEKDKTGKEIVKYKVRQILLKTGFQAPGSSPSNPSPFEGPEDIARQAVQQEKLEKLITELAGRNNIKLPEDFTI